eukprot:scaffold140842_cov36-Cyclotella_meneghiniana.AAC.1
MPRIPPHPEIKEYPPPKSRLAFIMSLPSYIQQFAVDDAFMTNCIPPPGPENVTTLTTLVSRVLIHFIVVMNRQTTNVIYAQKSCHMSELDLLN